MKKTLYNSSIIINNLMLPTILLVSLILRLPYLTERSIWYDEAASWQTAKFPLSELLESVRQNVHMPLYYILLKAWMAAWGESVSSLRGFSIAFGVLTVYAASLFGRELYRASATSAPSGASRNVEIERGARDFGLVLAGLVAVSAYQIYASIECKMYSLSTAISVLSAWLILRILRGVQVSILWIYYCIFCIFILYLHHYGMFVVLSHMIFWISYLLFLAVQGDRARFRGLLVPWAVVSAVVTIIYLPGIAILKGQVGHVQRGFWIRPLSWDSFLSTFADFVRPSPGYDAFDLLPHGEFVAEIVVISAIVIAVRGRRGDYLVIALSLLPMAFAAMASMVTPVWVPRYFRMIHPFLLSLVALAVWRAPRMRTALFSAIFAALLAANVAFWRSLDIPGGPGVRGAVELALTQRRGDEMIIATDFVQYFPAKYYARHRARVRLLDESDKPFWGEQLIRPSDRVTRGEMSAELRRGVWVIGKDPDPRHGFGPGSDKIKLLIFKKFNHYTKLHDNISLIYCILEEGDGPVESGRPPR